ncbi:MAG: leucyl/phenylalanyl-tRNA--protein transferase [Chitinophagaceae bacterium]
MPLFRLGKELLFPPVQLSEPDGLLAIGGDLSVERLLQAYRHGIFPWYEREDILWWCPNPRFVLFPENLVVSKSMTKVIRQPTFTFTVNKAFEQVISNCKAVSRLDQDGTWITEEVKKAYIHLHHLGYTHSAEAWQDGELVGGLYGVRLGRAFFGESMFSTRNNASKFAFIKYVEQLKNEGVELIDCQVYTAHLESLGASMISRSRFLGLLEKLV